MSNGRVAIGVLIAWVVFTVLALIRAVYAQNYLVTCQLPHDYTVRLQVGTPAMTPTPAVTPPTTSKGTKCVACTASNTDSGSAYVIQLFDNNGTNNILLGSVNVPLSSGNTSAAATVNLLSSTALTGLPLDGGAGGNPYFLLTRSDQLMVASTTAVAAAKNVDITCQCCDF